MASGKRTAIAAQTIHTRESNHSGRQTPERSVSPELGRQVRRRRPEKSRTREERVEEEIHFNLGYPKNIRAQTPTRGQRRGRPGRENTDYPPPSYEAASASSNTPTISQNSSNLGLLVPLQSSQSPATSGSDPSLSAQIPSNAARPSLSPSPHGAIAQSETEPETDSEIGSLELLDIDPSGGWEGDRQQGLGIQERAVREFERQKRRIGVVESPLTPTHPSHHLLGHSNSLNVGRNTPKVGSRLSLQIVMDQRIRALGTLESPTELASPAPRRKSPMKSLSPSRFFQDRSQPTHASQSVISLLRSPNPLFKNTPSASSPVAPRNATKNVQVSRLPRKLFHLKSNTKVDDSQAEGPIEPLEDWEILDTDHSSEVGVGPYESPAEDSRVAFASHHPAMSPRVASAELQYSGRSPRPTHGMADASVSEHDVDPRVATPRQTPPSSPFLTRNVRRPSPLIRPGMSPSSAPTSPTCVSLPSTPTSLSSPNLTNGPFTESPVSEGSSPQRDHPRHSPSSLVPARTGTRRIREDTLISTNRTLEGPRSTTHSSAVTHIDYDTVTPVIPIVPLVGHAGLAQSSLNPAPRSPTNSRQNSAEQNMPPSRNILGHGINTYSIEIPSDSAPPYTPPLSPTPTRGGHYPWRPLPQPPQSVTPPLSLSSSSVIDDDTFDSSNAQQSTVTRHKPIPEGLLIDLSDEEEDQTNATGSTFVSLLDDGEAGGYDGSDVGTSVTELVTPTTGQTSVPGQFLASSNVSSESFRVQGAPLTAGHEYTDLDAALSHIGDQHHDGSDYEALLRIAEFIGPANPHHSHEHVSIETVLSSCLVGNVELVRRRVTKDGRIKLKLSLLGVPVNGCTICLSQFKESQRGILGFECQHAFHENCLKNWLARNRTCPLCRKRLDACD